MSVYSTDSKPNASNFLAIDRSKMDAQGAVQLHAVLVSNDRHVGKLVVADKRRALPNGTLVTLAVALKYKKREKEDLFCEA